MKLRLFGMLLLALSVTAFGQTYLYNQAVAGTGKSPVAVVAGDFNRDGQLDLAVVNQNDNTVSVILSTTGGSFASKVDYPVGASPVAIVSGDFNGDGSLDLAVVNSQDNTISTLLGSATGLFSPQQTFPTGAMPVSIVAVDLNSDKRLDLATANQTDGTVSVLLPSPHKQLSLPHLGWQDLCRPTLPATPCRTWLSRPSTGTSCC